ncbi:MAG TPA: hypothetical protein VEA69_16210 [Tepidisphaeraceae bacterium]|nr:hypothetical protein [Tepidisphaeraceae bacterium]
MLLSNVNDLAEKIRSLQEDRLKHLKAIEEIDRVLDRVNNVLGTVETAGANGNPAPPARGAGDVDRAEPGAARHKRGRFAKVAEASVLDFIRDNGTPSTAEINAHWRREGRKGTANVTLFKLLREGRIRRIADDSVRGSRYTAAKIGAAAAS